MTFLMNLVMTAFTMPHAATRIRTTTILPSKNVNMDESTGKCKYGIKRYWDDMYKGKGDRPSDSYSWYCGWDELAPFWRELVPDQNARTLIVGMGNDPTPISLYDEGWKTMTAFDYSQAGVERAKCLFGPDRDDVNVINADARDLPISDGSMNAVLDKGTLDAIYITGEDVFQDAIKELTRVTALGGVVVCVINVIPPQAILSSFQSTLWKNIHDGGLAFAPDGEATIDLGANLYSWQRV